MQLDGYIRVSRVAGREGERFQSPGVQRAEIERHIIGRGAEIGEIFEELDESGGNPDRPLLQAAIERVERGVSGGIVVAKLNRFGRSFLDGIQQIARIREAGGTLVSVQQGFDLKTPAGRLVARMLFAVAEWELDQVRENWDSAREAAIARGVYFGPMSPVGMRRTRSGRLVVDAETAPRVLEAFERTEKGQTHEEVAEFLNAAGLKTPTGLEQSAESVSRLLKNPVYRGEVRHGKHSNPEAHEPVVDPALWHACQSPPRRSRTRPRAELFLGGLVRCGGCKELLVLSSPNLKRKPQSWPRTEYRCHTGKACPAPSHVRADELEPLIEEFAFRPTEKAPRRGTRQLEKAEAAVDRARGALADYRDSPYLLARLGTESYEQGIDRRQGELERRMLDLSKAKQAAQVPGVDPKTLAAEWPDLSWKERNRKIQEFIDLVVIERGSGPLIERAVVYRRGRGPVLKSRSKGGWLKDPSGPGSRFKPLRRWKPAQIEAELRQFLGGRTSWPPYVEFARAGRSRLYAQTWMWGGPFYWAVQIGVEVPEKMFTWTMARVEGSLRPVLESRDTWPSKSEFESKGLGVIQGAAQRHGGLEHWAEEFGVAYRGRSQKWTKERLEVELRERFPDRHFFPRHCEFLDMGRKTLWEAMQSNGGKEYWARRLGWEIPAGSREARR